VSELGVGDVGVSTKGKEGSRGSKGNVEDLGEEEGKGDLSFVSVGSNVLELGEKVGEGWKKGCEEGGRGVGEMEVVEGWGLGKKSRRNGDGVHQRPSR